MSITKATGAFWLSRALLFLLIFFFSAHFFFFQRVLNLSLPPPVDKLSDSFLYSPPQASETPADRRAKAMGLPTPLWGAPTSRIWGEGSRLQTDPRPEDCSEVLA